MTLAEVLLLVAGGAGVYYLLRPLQRVLERYLARKFLARKPHSRRQTIDVTDFTSYESRRKEDDHE